MTSSAKWRPWRQTQSDTIKEILVVVLPAIVGFVWPSFDTARKDALAYTSLQMEKLYGPLYAVTQPSDRIWSVYDKRRNTPVENDVSRRSHQGFQLDYGSRPTGAGAVDNTVGQ